MMHCTDTGHARAGYKNMETIVSKQYSVPHHLTKMVGKYLIVL